MQNEYMKQAKRIKIFKINNVMDKKMMLEQVINHYTDGNKAKFANMLGVKPQTINTWLLRNTYDAELIYSKCDGISGDWLLSGKGEMNKNIQNEYVDVRQDNELLNLCKLLVHNFQQRDEVMDKLVSMISKID